ncbi:MAG: Modification methylase MjaII [Methanomethylovorans sp. PtaU1.Bin073]|nr:MAG: Modification methylase MjaII [Methanomethylovorans sp. PtaU1.Bin073]
MELITCEMYRDFLETRNEVLIGNSPIKLSKIWNISNFEPRDCRLETTTIWSFPDRGNWATHDGKYRGNWSPIIPRNLILRYTKKGDTVLDQMVGSGTTLVECKLLERNAIGVDINPDSIMVARNRLDFTYLDYKEGYVEPRLETYVGDARNLDLVGSNTIDLIATHPPYANIIPYSGGSIENDLSNISMLSEFEKNMMHVARECFRVLKPNKYCAILIGDTRRRKHYIPLSTLVMQVFLDAGFILKEDVIKHQWNTTSSFNNWPVVSNDFYLIAHEHLFIFRKPKEKEAIEELKGSSKWW